MKQYSGLWLLLVVSLGLFTFYSFFDGNLFGWELKKCSIADDLTALPSITTSINDSKIACADSVSAPKPIKAELDTASKTILFVGDSMLEGLGPRMASYAKKNGHKLYNVIWYSSTSEIWGSCDTLTYFIRKFKPDYILVSLGANELFVSNIKKKRAKYVQNILKQIGNIPYVWIGPPNWKPDTGINDLLQETLPAGNFFLTNGMKFDRAKDGAHPTRNSAVLWMDSVATWIKTKSNHPIKIEKPEEKTARANSVTVLQPKR